MNWIERVGGKFFKTGGKGVIPKFNVPKRVTDKLPKKWNTLSSSNRKGIKYVNPKNPNYDYIRFMDKNNHPKAPIGQQKPYFIRVKEGNKYLTKNGKWVLEGSVNEIETHIPQSMFEELLPYMDLK